MRRFCVIFIFEVNHICSTRLNNLKSGRLSLVKSQYYHGDMPRLSLIIISSLLRAPTVRIVRMDIITFSSYFATLVLFALLGPFVGSNITNGSSILLQGGTVISFNTTTLTLEVLRNHSVLIEDDRINTLATSIDPSLLPNDIDIINCSGKIVSPGFVDTHRHGWQTPFRTIGSNTTLSEYLLRYGEAAAVGEISADDAYLAELMGLYEALNAGVTSIVDFAHHIWSPETARAGLTAAADSQARVWWSYAIHDLDTNFTVDQQFDDLTRLATDQNNVGGDLQVSIGIAYDFFDGGDVNESQRVVDLARYVSSCVLYYLYNKKSNSKYRQGT